MPALSGVRKLLPYGDKARKFAKRHPRDDKRINILEGSVRSSKTWAMIPKILQLCRYNVIGQRVLTGVSKTSIYNNVLDDIFEIVGSNNYTYNRQSGDLTLMGTRWLVIGAKDEGSEKYIRGLTVGVAVNDELTLQPESFVMMLLNRMSPAGARYYATTNPDNPFHFVKVRILDNEEWRKMGVVWSEHFTLDDNPHLEKEYKEVFVAGFKGLYRKRYIEGLWVAAEGAIYKDCWDDCLMYDEDSLPEKMTEARMVGGVATARYIGTDYGTDNPMVFLDVLDDGECLWVDREYYWDSRSEMRQKTDHEYGNDLEEFLKEAPGAQVIIPPEAASFIAEIRQRGIWYTTADNEVEDGIRNVSVMMARRKLRIHKRCKRTLQEIPAYVWDPKKSDRGVEQPVKKNDHGVDALRYVVKTMIPPWRLAA